MTGYPSANVAGEDARLTRAAQAGDAAFVTATTRA